MHRILTVAIGAAALAASSLPVTAAEGRNTAAVAGALGGLAVGTMLGSALAAPQPVQIAPQPRAVYVAPQPVYVEPVEVVEEECHIRRERVYVSGHGWEVRRSRVCY